MTIGKNLIFVVNALEVEMHTNRETGRAQYMHQITVETITGCSHCHVSEPIPAIVFNCALLKLPPRYMTMTI
jgi:hypothetical protein